MQIKFKKLCLTLISVSLFQPVVPAFAQPTTLAPSVTNQSANTNSANSNSGTSTSDDKVVLNFENADIQTVIKAISKLSGKNFVIDPRVKGTVNIVSEKPISKAESYKVLESALRMQGFATVEADGVIKVLPETDARTYGMRTDSQIRTSPGDQLITRVFTIDNGSATQLANTLRPMISPNNSIAVYPNSNALVVTDYASNMARISKVIADLSVSKETRLSPVTINLKYAFAGDVAQTLQSYMGNAGGSSASASGDNGPSAIITVDSNTNSIIITSNVQSKLNDLRNLALSLDKNTGNNNNNLHVVYLRNADAAHVAEVLRVIASGQDNPDMTASPASRTLSDTSSMFQSSGGSGSSGGGGSMMGGGGGGQNQSRPTSNSSRSSNSQSGDQKNAPKVLIQAEPTTNSLIIQAPEAMYRNLRMVVDMLDVRRVQVMIEALIANVNATEGGSFGIQWLGGLGNNTVGAGVLANYAGNNNSLSSIATNVVTAAQGANGSSGGTSAPTLPNEVYVGLVTGTVTIGGQQIPGISALADMIATNSAGNILGRPTLLTLDNEEASIFVGSNIGIPSGSYATTGGNSTVNPFTTVSRQDLGTVLRLKPLVTQSGAIELSIYQEDSALDANTPVNSANGPSFLKRTLKTQILVNDGQMIALGGMTQDSVQLQSNGIPFLSSIPYLGWLFSWQSRTHTKQNLVIFLRPLIIRNEQGIQALTNQRYRYIMDQENMVQAKGNALLPQINPVNLENQVPYNSQIPPQPASTPSSPLIDLRNGVSNNNGMVTPNPAPTATGSGNANNNSRTWQNNNGITVSQTAPNAVAITNNNN